MKENQNKFSGDRELEPTYVCEHLDKMLRRSTQNLDKYNWCVNICDLETCIQEASKEMLNSTAEEFLASTEKRLKHKKKTNMKILY